MELVLKYVVDVFLLVVFALNVLFTMRKGFIRCMLSLVCVLVSVAAAATYSHPAAEWTYDNIVSDYVVNKVESSMNEEVDSQSAAQAIQSVVDSIPSVLTDQLNDLDVDIDEVSTSIDNLQLSTKDTAEKISEQIIRPGALVILRLICYVLIFAIVRLVTGILIGVICAIAKLPILKNVNKLLGALLGIIKGAAVVVSIVLLLNLCVDLIKNNDPVVQAIENSRICDIIEEIISDNLNLL